MWDGMSLHCCNLIKPQSCSSILSRVSLRPKCSNPSKPHLFCQSHSFSNGFLQENPQNNDHPKSTPTSSLSWISDYESRNPRFSENPQKRSNWAIKTGANSAIPTSEGFKEGNSRRRFSLNQEGKKDNNVSMKSSSFSWGDAAKTYFRRNEENEKLGIVVSESAEKELPNKNGRSLRDDHSKSSWFSNGRRESKSREGDERGNIDRRKERDRGNEDRQARIRSKPPIQERVGYIYEVEDHEDFSNNEEGDINDDDEEGEESIDDSRWTKIKERVADRRDRFERPEVVRWNKQESWGKKTWTEAKESKLPKMVGEVVYGVGPVLAAVTMKRREFYALYVQEGLELSSRGSKKKDKRSVGTIMKFAEEMGLTIKETSKHDLNMLADNRPHQGLILDTSPLQTVNIHELEEVGSETNKSLLWVALDEVTDPQNFGAVVRSAYFFGAAGVIVCAKNSAPLSGVVSKASAGSLECIELRSCKNMMQFLTASAQNGWRVLGGSVSSKASPLSEVAPAAEPTILVLGSEGKGLRPLVERSCTQLVMIPGKFPDSDRDEEDSHDEVGGVFQSFLAVESLNVSVAAGVLLFHLLGTPKPCLHSHVDGHVQ